MPNRLEDVSYPSNTVMARKKKKRNEEREWYKEVAAV